MPALPPADGATPAMAQWFAAKAAHPDALLFFRMGDFYELFFADAEAAAAALDIALSHRGEHRGEPIPMCGVPAHAAEPYLARLIRQGFRVAICEQTETPEEAKARRAPTIRREVVRIVSPGTVTEEALLDGARPSWLLALAESGGRIGAAWADVSTGAFRTEALSRADIPALLARLEPAEILAPAGLLPGAREAIPPADPARRLAASFGVADAAGFGEFTPAELAAAATLLDYLAAAGPLPRLDPPAPQGGRGLLLMDAATRRSLDILRCERGDARNTLLSAVDRTLSAAGRRELAARLAAPLADLAAIRARQAEAEALAADAPLAEAIRARLRGLPDLERALARLSVGRFAPRDLAAIRDGLAAAEAIAARLAEALLPPAIPLRPPPGLAAELARALAEPLPARIEEGGVIARGYDGELDALRALREDARGAVAALQRDLAEAWGVASLRIRHHQQLGYLAEMPAAAGERLLRAPPALPPDLAPIHRQSMANAQRFTCPALAALDRRIAEAAEQAAKREAAAVSDLVRRVLAEGAAIAATARALAALDVAAASAVLLATRRWTLPALSEGREFVLTEARHPVVEAALARARGPAFVPNDLDLSPGRRLLLLTGPNMAGKSTYLRQAALAVVLAQAGLPVPAASARIGLVDRLFSRVGAADDIAEGRSTFMVEMTETAAILNQATERSLVVLDEVGRGTATWDGLAIAWAVLEALHDRLRCRGIFATHFRELTALSGKLPELACARMLVAEHKGEVVFQHLVGPGVADRSWGLHVARLAGVPRPVLARAGQVLAALEARAEGLDPLAEELPLFGAAPRPQPPVEQPSQVFAILDETDPDSLSPREALEILYRLKASRAADSGGR
ncbi:MAG: DNA mismatch repair protein MutS [Acetobacteraceae bacterium]|nr:DNA mismatch repair protein MutS [Acetobacteraceae bacterium]